MDFNEAQNSIDIKENYIMCLDKRLLGVLLKDKSSGENIIWATDMYAWRGSEFHPREPITVQAVTGRRGNVIKPHIEKSKKEQKERIRKKAEVFTPSWICNLMASGFDSWFGQENVFNTPDGLAWKKSEGKITFPENKSWKDYIRLRVLEITCGEAPFLASRYDTVTGEWIDVNSRVGLLDRKLRVVNENTDNEADWIKYAFEAYQSTYGFEWQGDSLLIARENLLFTFIDYYNDKFGILPEKDILMQLANILSWNIFQMDGLKYVVPYSCEGQTFGQITLFDEGEQISCQGCSGGDNSKHIGIYSKVKNWRAKTTFDFFSLTGGNGMKFDFIIGNPPYQDNTIGDNKTFAPQIYNTFLDCAYTLSDKVEMIHPARFLFNAGSTPKQWNEKMLQDEHLKVLAYYAKSADVFPTTDIKGGVAITYRDVTKDFGAISVFTPYNEINSIFHKVKSNGTFSSFSKIIYSAYSYHLTEQVYKDNPNLFSRLSKGHEYDLKSNIFELMPEIFFDKKQNEDDIQVLGRLNSQRVFKWTNKSYITDTINFNKYKVFMAGANGSGAIGEVLSTPLIGQPLIGHTETFISIGAFDTKNEVENCLKYVKTKFARTLLGILKVTQAITPDKWKYVPMQDFTSNSDIDWQQAVAEIDIQLYKKYGLSDEEIAFIETHVKEMI